MKEDSNHYIKEKEVTSPVTSVIRKFINPAVYIESSPTNMPVDSSHFKVKKCTCTNDHEICPCHPDKTAKTHCVKVSPLSSKSSVKTDSGYSGDTNLERDDLRLSLTSLTANSLINNRNEEIRRKAFLDWLEKKKKEQMMKQMLEEELKRKQEAERAKKEKEERENFRKWLLKKKLEEEQKRLEQQKREEEERLKSARPKHDPEETKMAFKAWLERKKQETLGWYQTINI